MRCPLWIWRSFDRVTLARASALPLLAATGVFSRLSTMECRWSSSRRSASNTWTCSLFLQNRKTQYPGHAGVVYAVTTSDLIMGHWRFFKRIPGTMNNSSILPITCSRLQRRAHIDARVVFRALAIEILDIMIQGLGVDAKHFQAHKEESVAVMRANYYHKGGEHVLGLPPHVDGNILTILHQQDVSGLEVLKDGRWVAIQPQTQAFCINVGDMMQVLSNGQYRSIQHRAISSTTAARLSVAYFLRPGLARRSWGRRCIDYSRGQSSRKRE